MLANDTTVRIAPITPAVGGVVEGVDMRGPLDPETVRLLRGAWLDRGVLFFRNQDISEAQLQAFVAHFGTPIPEPSNAAIGYDPDAPPVHSGETGLIKAVTERWHADATWLAEPPMATALRIAAIPEVGGDTCWANVTTAYEALFAPLRALLDSLTAIHWILPSLEALGTTAHNDETAFVHPVVRVHPETGRRAIYVSEGWTRKIVELPQTQGTHLLSLIYDHIKAPAFNMRWRWAPGDVAFWDNRAVQHYAVPDYDRGRFAQRIVLAGDRPYGPGQEDRN